MRSDDYNWYKQNLNSLHEQYGEKYIAIKDKSVLGAYDSYFEGVEKTSRETPIGSFIIQRCGPDEAEIAVRH